MKKKGKAKPNRVMIHLKHDYKIVLSPEFIELLKDKELFMDEGRNGGDLLIYFFDPANSDGAVKVEALLDSRKGTCEIPIPHEFSDSSVLLHNDVFVEKCQRGLKIYPGKKPPVEDLE